MINNIRMPIRDLLDVKHQERQLLALLNSIPDINPIGFMSGDGDVPSPSDYWRQVSLLSSQPTDRVSADASDEQIDTWLKQWFDSLEVAKEYMVAVGGFSLPWMRLEVPALHDWVTDFWRATSSKEILIAPAGFEKAIAVTEEEYFYYIYLTALTRHEAKRPFDGFGGR